MKSLIITALIIGGVFLGYDYFLAPPKERVVFKRQEAPSEKRVQPDATSTLLPGSTSAAKTRDNSTQAQPPVDTPKLPPGKAPPSETPVVNAVSKPDTAIPGRPAFIPPRFESIEVLTGSWKKVPSTAFPRTVKLLKDTTFKFSVGSSVVRAGAAVVALRMDNGQLIIAPNDKSPARQVVPVENTDLKAILVQLYERWKIDRIEEARKIYEENLRHPKPAVANVAPAVDASGKPLQAADGKYPLLLAQLQKGTPSEITPLNITCWKEPVQGTYKGTPTWIVEVSYKTKTLFGEMNIDSLVHVQNGKVVDWVFKGSGEAVP